MITAKINVVFCTDDTLTTPTKSSASIFLKKDNSYDPLIFIRINLCLFPGRMTSENLYRMLWEKTK